jgi:murein DD-endopeptidase MepM/ murein hydrolase activator NlpD
LQAPLRYSRISSSFTRARFHPILKRTRPHQGIDYAAPTGTPVWAVGNGVVIYRGWGGGYGNLVKVRHEGGYVSYYAHLSRFAKGLRVGQRVSQKQVIGHVGATGLATGPHVCFRITKDGRYVDPARVSRPTADPIPARMRADFYGTRDELLAQLGTRPSFETFEAL